MAISEDSDGQFKWTYTLEDGVCTNSLALVTAAKFGLPDSILKRAQELSSHWDTDGGSKSVSIKPRLASEDNNLQRAMHILEDVAGQNESAHIPPSFMPPPSFEGTACVYILQIGNESSGLRYYVGETDSLSKRLLQHRAKGKEWSSLNAIAIQIEQGKSSARNVESLVIQRMARSGFDMVSITDGRSIRNAGLKNGRN